MNISKQQIEKAISNGAKNLKDIQQATFAFSGNKCKGVNIGGLCYSGVINKMHKKDNNNIEKCCYYN